MDSDSPRWLNLRSGSEIRGPEHQLTDSNDASPVALEMPAELTEFGDKPPYVELPQKDFDETMTDPALKGEPTPVTNPGNNPPAKVDEPIKPADTAPTYEKVVSSKPNLTDLQTQLARAYGAGELEQRGAEATSKQVKLYQTVSCERSFSNSKTVTFYDFDGNVLKQIWVEYEDSLGSHRDEYPSYERAGDDRYQSYVFRGWVYFGTTNPTSFLDLDSIVVSQDLAISPYYDTEKRYYDVTWSVPDKNLSQNQRLDYWQLQAAQSPFGESDLAREPEGAISFIFLGWTRTQTDYKVTFTAEYDRIGTEYRITWIVEGKTYYTYVLEGDLADDREIPKDITFGNYITVFSEWKNDMNKTINDPVTQNLTFVASYIQQESFATVENDAGQEQVCAVEHTETSIILKPNANIVWFQTLRDYLISENTARQGSGEAELSMEIAWNGFVVTLTQADLQALSDLRCIGIRLVQTGGANNGTVYYQIEFLKAAKRVVAYDGTLSMRIPAAYMEGTKRAVYADVNGTLTNLNAKLYDDGYIRFSAAADTRFLYENLISIKATDPSDRSQYSAIAPWAFAGDVIDLNVKCVEGCEVVGAILTYADGRVETITGNSFVMPDVPVSVELIVDRIAFDITFIVDGEIYEVIRLYYKDDMILPEAPTKAEDDQYIYTFAGWSPEVWSRAVYIDNRAPEFTAIFTAHEKSGTVADSYRGSLLLRVILIGVSGMLLAAGFVLAIIYRKRIGGFVRAKLAPSAKKMESEGVENVENGDGESDASSGETKTGPGANR